MEFSIFIKKIVGKGLLWGACIYFGLPLLACAQSHESNKSDRLVNRNYISAFTSPKGTPAAMTIALHPDSMYYTIQLCSLDHLIKDKVLLHHPKIKIVPMGEVYRYLFSIYPSVAKAREELKWIRKLYPEAYIREYKNGKPGLAIDLNIDHIRINN